MNAKFLKATTFVVAGLFASVAVAQDDAAAPEVPAGPTPQEVAAQNMSDLLNLVKQGRSRASGENRAREQRFTQDKANQQSELNRAERERAAEERNLRWNFVEPHAPGHSDRNISFLARHLPQALPDLIQVIPYFVNT